MSAPRFRPIVEPPRPQKPTTEHQRRQADLKRAAVHDALKAHVAKQKEAQQ
jgi:hypothetical protein